MYKINGISVSALNKNPDFISILSKKLNISKNDITEIEIIKKSIDSRRKNDIKFVYNICFNLKKELILPSVSKYKKFEYIIPKANLYRNLRPVVVGFGPAGIFCSLLLAISGLKPIIIERGKEVDERQVDIDNFKKNSILNEESNVQFGEGGAGTFSDGKLNTGINDERIRFVLETFVKFGAPTEILIDGKPHIGTDYLKVCIKNIREYIKSLGGTFEFNAKFNGLKIRYNSYLIINYLKGNQNLELSTNSLILSIGHSSRDTFRMLEKQDFKMVQKTFSVGVRCEHLQSEINASMYGEKFEKYGLPPANYKSAVHLNNGRSLYTFCMCPGGEVVAATSLKCHVVTNGMSYYKRNEINANSALLCNVFPEDLKSSDPLAGVNLQEEIEKKAFIAAGSSYKAPCIKFGDFLENKLSTNYGNVLPSYKPGVEFVSPNDYLPSYICESIKDGIPLIGKKIEGFDNPDTLLTGPESRSTSPVRILRDSKGVAIDHPMVYPCGEGAGYAGGIMSAAIDGMKTAENIIKKYLS